MNIYKCVSERDALYSYVLYASNELIKLSHFYEWQIKKNSLTHQRTQVHILTYTSKHQHQILFGMGNNKMKG